jgi:putative polyketide hydroxylase
LGRWVSILFQTDLREALKGRKVTLCFVSSEMVDGIMGQLGGAEDRWWLFANVKQREGEQVDAPSDAYCLDLIRAAIGIPEQPAMITSTLPWVLAIRVAERYQEGRVFLVGDAAHVMTMMGAFGANTGIADAHNLAWKLALVLKGKADEHLLESYGQERQRVAELAVGVSSGLYAYRLSHQEQREEIMRSAEEMLGHVRASVDSPRPTGFSVVDGYRYRSDAVVRERDNDGTLYENEPSGRLGTRAPHVWLKHEGKQVSTLDLYGREFVLLTGSGGERWHELWAEVASRAEISIAEYCIGQGQQYEDEDEDGSFLASYGISDVGAVLVRPDGFIAWRSQDGANRSVGEEMWVVVSRLLGYDAG